MELPSRDCGDVLLPPGELVDIRRRIRAIAPKHNLTSVIACAFDFRTRMLPFVLADMRMVPGGVRDIGSAMVDSGLNKTRIVLQQWNRNFDPSTMQLDGRVPDIFMVSSMQIHSAMGEKLIRDACRIDPAKRPLIIAGGPKVIYQPWDVFGTDPDDPWGADVAVTGESYVLLNLLEVLLGLRGHGESMRQVFFRARDEGALEGIPGLVYGLGSREGVAEELVDTGIQRLVGDLDELADSVYGYRILERPGKKTTLASNAMGPKLVGKHAWVGGLMLTAGCKFSCPYCPIPSYNQRQLRTKSGPAIVDEMVRLYRAFGLRYFFGCDDNFFNDKDRTIEIVETMAGTQVDGKPFRKIFRWGTEATIHDTLVMKDHLKMVRKAGLRALWLGVEDMTGTLIKKGQSVDKTIEAFRVLQARGISPMPMMMHHDSQPLVTRGSSYGLLNQVRLLRKTGAVSLQVLMITPATGSKLYSEAFTSGHAFKSVASKQVASHMIDGNYVIASNSDKPWRNQLNILAAYMYFYNPFQLLCALVRPTSRLYLADVAMQVIGMYGLMLNIRRTIGWAFRLRFGKIIRQSTPPGSPVPMRSPDGLPASHAINPEKQVELPVTEPATGEFKGMDTR